MFVARCWLNTGIAAGEAAAGLQSIHLGCRRLGLQLAPTGPRKAAGSARHREPHGCWRRTLSSATNPFSVLGLKPGCSEAEIAVAYRRLALKYHPDKNPDDKNYAEYMFKRVSDARTRALELTATNPCANPAASAVRNNAARRTTGGGSG